MAGVYSRDERHEKDLRNTVRTDALAISLYFWGRKNSSPDRPYRPSLADVPNRPSLGGGYCRYLNIVQTQGYVLVKKSWPYDA